MGKFQLNKKGEDPIKIYEDTFKVANSTVETHLGKLGKMPNPIAREANEDDDEYEYGFIPKVSGFGEDKDKNLPIKDHTHNFTSGYQLSNGIDYILQCSDSGCGATKNKDLYMESKAKEVKSGYTEEDYGEYLESVYEGGIIMSYGIPFRGWRDLEENDNDAFREGYNNWLDGLEKDGVNTGVYESKAKEVNGKYIINGMVIGKVTDFEPNNWFGKVELSEMPEFAEYGTLDPQAVVKGDDGVTYTDPKGGSDGSRGTLFDADGSPKPPIVSWGEVEAIAKEVDENEKDEIFQYLFELQDSGATNMMGASPYVEREFPHLDKKEVGNIVVEWMSNWDEIAQRMGIESRASEWKDPHEKAKKKLRNQGNSMGMDDINYGLQEPYNDSDESWNSVEAIAKEAISENEKDEMFQYLFDLQDSGITNMFGAGPYVEREFPHFDKKEVREVVLEWMHNYEAIHARMGISRESRANEKSVKQACKNAGISLSKAEKIAEMNGMDLQAVVDAGNLEEMLEDQRQDDDWLEREARAEFGNQ